MKVVDSLLNRSEAATLLELETIASDNGLKVFSKPRLSDVIQKGNARLTDREFEFYTRSHCDFVLTNAASKPLMIVEYDGPLHQSSAKQRERDEIKNELCRRAEIGLLRINDRYVTKLYRGMSVLRWIVEVTELEKAFDDAQQKGLVAWDELFDPAFLQPGGSSKRFPYWLSATASLSIKAFFKTLDRDLPKGWSGIVGNDGNGAGRRLSCLYFGDQVLYSSTGVRRQDLSFPAAELLDELDMCELGLALKRFQSGQIVATSPAEFRRVFEDFCERYNANPSHSMGGFPFETSWGSATGWKYQVVD